MPLDVLERFGAQASRAWIGDELSERGGPGGELSAGVERLGLELLGGLFYAHGELNAVELQDPSVSVRADRAGQVLQVKISWEQGPSFEECLPIAPVAGLAGHTGPWLVPDGSSRLSDLRAGLRSGISVSLCESGEGLRAFSRGVIAKQAGALPLLARIPEQAQLGSADFCARLGIRHAYVAGAMAGGIASAALVIAMAKTGLVGFFGSGGLPLEATEEALKEITRALGSEHAYGANLLHNPVEPAMEMATVDLYAKYGVRVVSASAFMGLTPALLKYRYKGIREVDGKIHCPNTLLAKISRTEVARHFVTAPSASALQELVDAGHLTETEAMLAQQIPVADALTCEADSGGHTDRRPLPVLLPLIIAQRDVAVAEHGRPIFVGAAGGLGTPHAIVGALAMGAEYVLTGSVNQCTPEAGTSQVAKEMLLQAGMADCAEGPAPDMFELGAHVQVLSRGTMYAKRGQRLYEMYKQYGAWEEVPAVDRAKVEKQILQAPFEEIWMGTRDYWQGRDPAQVVRAESNGRHKMALVFRWYLGMTSRWARVGEPKRKLDYQIWCGPSMGAFNAWVAGTAMEPLSARKVADVAQALIDGSLQLQRAQALVAQGVALPPSAWNTRPDSA
jgi:PfaD family protein